jgi:hypothetical protein
MSQSLSSRTDQAAGLRRLFAGAGQRLVPVVYNPQVDCAGVLLERFSLALAQLGARTLVVDAADNAPRPHELIDIELSACIERLDDNVAYLAANGVPRRQVDARGSSEAWLTAVEQAAPWADVILLHAGARDLARMVGPREVSPLLLATLESASLTDAYGSMKLLTQRLGLRVYDLLVGMHDRPRRAAAVGERLASCADNFLGTVLRSCVAIDRHAPLNTPAPEALSRLAAQQLLGLAGAGELAMPAAPRRPSAALTN